jgi:hypothetical protein
MYGTACTGDVRHTHNVDVTWFCRERAGREENGQAEAALRAMDPTISWSVWNQARMHGRNGAAPYASATDAMRFWPETAAAIMTLAPKT